MRGLRRGALLAALLLPALPAGAAQTFEDLAYSAYQAGH